MRPAQPARKPAAQPSGSQRVTEDRLSPRSLRPTAGRNAVNGGAVDRLPAARTQHAGSQWVAKCHAFHSYDV